MKLLQQLQDSLGRVADAAADSLRVRLKTNLGPALTLYDGRTGGSGGAGVASLLGLKAAVSVEDQAGRVIYQTGPAPATEPRKVVLLVAGVAVAGFLLVKALRK